MKIRYFFLIFVYSISAAIGVEQSIIPLMEKTESLSALPIAKYSTSQFAEIEESLNRKTERLRLVTYNMLAHTYDYKTDPVNRWPQRLPRILDLLDEMQADIIGAQELYDHQAQDILDHFGETYVFYALPCDDGEQNGIFYRKDRFEVVDSHVWYMSETPEVPDTETLTMLTLRDLRSGQTFAVFNAHLAFSNVNKRDYQARFIQKYAEKYAKNMPVLVTGDLNTFPNRTDLGKLPFYDGDYIHRLLTQESLRDARDMSLLGHIGPLSTFTNATDEAIPFTGIGTPGVLLDHVYISKGITVLLHAVQPGTVDGHFPSDHMPIVVDFLLSNN